MKPVEASPRPDEHLLYGVLSVEGRREHPIAIPRELATVRLELAVVDLASRRGVHGASFIFTLYPVLGDLLLMVVVAGRHQEGSLQGSRWATIALTS
jgi:hypothetical protein